MGLHWDFVIFLLFYVCQLYRIVLKYTLDVHHQYYYHRQLIQRKSRVAALRERRVARAGVCIGHAEQTFGQRAIATQVPVTMRRDWELLLATSLPSFYFSGVEASTRHPSNDFSCIALCIFYMTCTSVSMGSGNTSSTQYVPALTQQLILLRRNMMFS